LQPAAAWVKGATPVNLGIMNTFTEPAAPALFAPANATGNKEAHMTAAPTAIFK
jgi:hypothetical protein